MPKEKIQIKKNTYLKLNFILSIIIGITICSLIGYFYLFYVKIQKNQTPEKNIEYKNFIPNIRPPTTPPPIN